MCIKVSLQRTKSSPENAEGSRCCKKSPVSSPHQWMPRNSSRSSPKCCGKRLAGWSQWESPTLKYLIIYVDNDDVEVQKQCVHVIRRCIKYTQVIKYYCLHPNSLACSTLPSFYDFRQCASNVLKPFPSKANKSHRHPDFKKSTNNHGVCTLYQLPTRSPEKQFTL